MMNRVREAYLSLMRRISLKDTADAAPGPRVWEWCLVAAVFLLLFCSFVYGDTNSLVGYEVNFWGSAFDGGGVLKFYDYQVLMTRGLGGRGVPGTNYATYDWPMYLILGIWGLPLWLIYGAAGLSAIAHVPGFLYGKALFAVAALLCALLIRSICGELSLRREQAGWGAFVFLSSTLVLMPVALQGQADIIGVLFTLLGIRAYIRGQRFRFLLYFMIAIPCKQYALFVFIPLLLLVEKNLIRIALSGVFAMLLKLSQSFLFDGSSEAMRISFEFNKEMYDRMTQNLLPVMLGNVPVSLVCLAVPCVIAYLYPQVTDREERGRWAIWLPLLVLVPLFASFESSSYWYVHMAPYLAIMLVYNTGRLRHNFIFETAAVSALTVGNFACRSWPYEPSLCGGSLLARVLGRKLADGSLLENLMIATHLKKFGPALYAGFVVLMAALLWINRPSQIRSLGNANIRDYARIRFAANALVSAVPVLLFVAFAG